MPLEHWFGAGFDRLARGAARRTCCAARLARACRGRAGAPGAVRARRPARAPVTLHAALPRAVGCARRSLAARGRLRSGRRGCCMLWWPPPPRATATTAILLIAAPLAGCSGRAEMPAGAPGPGARGAGPRRDRRHGHFGQPSPVTVHGVRVLATYRPADGPPVLRFFLPPAAHAERVGPRARPPTCTTCVARRSRRGSPTTWRARGAGVRWRQRRPRPRRRGRRRAAACTAGGTRARRTAPTRRSRNAAEPVPPRVGPRRPRNLVELLRRRCRLRPRVVAVDEKARLSVRSGSWSWRALPDGS